MKKILLSLMLVGTFALVKGQNVVLNEVYGNPGGSNSEFIELYNSAASGSMDCYTIMTFYQGENGSTSGWYVLDLPNTPNINSAPGYYVLAPSGTFSVQGTAGAMADVNWNALTFRNGSTNGYLKQYEWNGSGYTDLNLPNGTSITNLLDGTLNGGQFYFVLLFRNGILTNGFIGGGASGDLATYAITQGSLTVPLVGSCGIVTQFTVDFANLTSVEFFNPSGGSDNGYARKNDGKCGSWVKTAPQVNHTPGVTNGSASGVAGELVTAQGINCNVPRTVSVNVTGVSGSVTEAEDFPVSIFVYHDANFDGIINDGPAIASFIENAVSDPAQTTGPVPDNNGDYIVVYQTIRGCFDKVIRLINGCGALPVNLKSFTAARVSSNVNLVWETVTEENNKGFYIQRKIGGGNWETIGFVPSQAVNGNSFSSITYEYTDNNSTRGITQYRLRQVDIDGKSAMSNIRAVRGDGQKGRTIVYPNPSSDGRVTVVFEDANVVRNVALIDMNGRMVKQWRNISNNNIQIENLTPGFYTVRIDDTETGEQTVEKIIVNKR